MSDNKKIILNNPDAIRDYIRFEFYFLVRSYGFVEQANLHDDNIYSTVLFVKNNWVISIKTISYGKKISVELISPIGDSGFLNYYYKLSDNKMTSKIKELAEDIKFNSDFLQIHGQEILEGDPLQLKKILTSIQAEHEKDIKPLLIKIKKITPAEAKKIGGQQGLISVGLGVLMAQLIMTFLTSSDKGLIASFLWFTHSNYLINILIGVLIMSSCGYLFGQLAGTFILIKKQNSTLIGFLIGLAIILTTTFFTSWIAFFQEGFDDIGTNDNPFLNYIIKPIYWVTLFSLLPNLLIGFWFGRQIKKKGKES